MKRKFFNKLKTNVKLIFKEVFIIGKETVSVELTAEQLEKVNVLK